MGSKFKFTEHVPGFCDISRECAVIEFDTQEELLSNALFENFKKLADFSHFAIGDQGAILAVYNSEPKRWWVLGFLNESSSVSLPKMIYPSDKKEEKNLGLSELTDAELFGQYKSHVKILGELIKEIQVRDISWRHLVKENMATQAVWAYAKENKCSLSEARKAVNEFLFKN